MDGPYGAPHRGENDFQVFNVQQAHLSDDSTPGKGQKRDFYCEAFRVVYPFHSPLKAEKGYP
jgi:hypothetical protein